MADRPGAHVVQANVFAIKINGPEQAEHGGLQQGHSHLATRDSSLPDYDRRWRLEAGADSRHHVDANRAGPGRPLSERHEC